MRLGPESFHLVALLTYLTLLERGVRLRLYRSASPGKARVGSAGAASEATLRLRCVPSEFWTKGRVVQVKHFESRTASQPRSEPARLGLASGQISTPPVSRRQTSVHHLDNTTSVTTDLRRQVVPGARTASVEVGSSTGVVGLVPPTVGTFARSPMTALLRSRRSASDTASTFSLSF